MDDASTGLSNRAWGFYFEGNQVKLSITEDVISEKIYQVRGIKVMFDVDLAELYGIQTRVLKQSVRRNAGRFPDDFMFELSEEEFDCLRSHFVTSNRGGIRYLPMAFTEQGVAMLSSVLNSERAVQVNIQIMRAFTRFRRMMNYHEDLRRKIDAMERKYDAQFAVVFKAIKQMIKDEGDTRKKKIPPNQ